MQYDFNVEDPLFFTSREDNVDLSTRYSAPLPYNWHETYNGDEWVMQYLIGKKISRQGWKVHISSEVKTSSDVLRIVAEICHKFSVPFKYLSTEKRLIFRNGKNVHRGYAGKFITCYPEEIILKKFINYLDSSLKEYAGPYILSDKRWKKAPVFLRYGVFRPSIKEDNFDLKIDELLINGEVVKDLREPCFVIPKGLDIPLFLHKWIDGPNIDGPNNENNIQSKIPFKIDNAIRFSNSGGIYLGEINKNKSIIKEARPLTGIDFDYTDAITRLKKEAHAMATLAYLNNIPNIYWEGHLWEHYFVAIEHMDGIPLNRWVTENYPIYSSEDDRKDYLSRVNYVINSIIQTMEEVHSNNIYHQDIHLGNILIDGNDNISIIDWEQVEFSNDFVTEHKIAAPGFRCWGEQTPASIDWYGIKQIAHHLYYPIIIQSDLVLNYVNQTVTAGDKLFKKLNYLNEDIDKFHRILQYLDTKDYHTEDKSKKKVLKPLKKELLPDNLTVDKLTEKLMKGLSLITDEWNIKKRSRYFPVHFYGVKINQGISFSDLGIIWAYGKLLKVSNKKNISDYYSIRKHIIDKTIFDFKSSISNVGLFDGIAGSIWIIHEMGEKDRAIQLYCDYLQILIGNCTNKSLYNGLSGVLLVGIYLIHKGLKDKKIITEVLDSLDCLSNDYLSNPEKICQIGVDKKQSNDPYKNHAGLIYGHAGIGWLFAEAYRLTGNSQFLKCLELSIENELKGYVTDRNDAIQYKQGGRLLPYLSNGNCGLLILLDRNKEYLNNYDQATISKLMKATDSNLCLFPGLFNGYMGMALVKNLTNSAYNLNEIVEGLKVYLHSIGDGFVLAGDNGLKITTDIYSGFGGIALGISSIKNNKFELLPSIN